MPRQSTARQQPINSFSSSADSSTSYLSARPKSHSPRSNFNPFSPLSPHPPDKELEGSDDEDDSGAIFNLEDGIRRVYTRLELVTVGEECRKRGFVKPKGMGSLESWYGNVPTHAQDPAIASIGPAPGRRNGGGGFGEGFGYGGGIGGKGLNRGGRNNGPRRNDHDGHGSTHGPLHGPAHGSGSKDISGGAMGKFAVKSTSDKMRMGGDENRRPKDEWRRDNPPHQPQRNDQRHWNSRQEEEATPAWMDDQPDHDPAISQIQEDRAFSPGEDRIAAQKRAMRGEGPERRALVGFFASETAPAPAPAPVKPVKEYKASNYLLPKTRQQQQVEPESTPTREAAGGSRFARSFGSPAQSEETTSRFFGNPSQHEEPICSAGRPSPLLALQPTTITTPPAQSPPPPADRTAALMAMLGAGPSSRTPAVSRPPVVSPPPPPPVPAPMFHNQAGFLQMQPPPGYGLVQANPNLGHDYRPMPQFYPGQAPPPPPQQHIYGGHPPPQLYHPQQRQGFLPPHNSGGQPSYHPPPPPGFAPEQHNFYPGGQPPPPQQPRNAAQQDKNLHALLNQWQPQHP